MAMVSRAEVEAQYVEMKVPLYSYGCEKKVRKALGHLKGIYSVSVDFKQQKVTVWGICNKFHVLNAIRLKRRAATFWNPDEDEDEQHHPPPPSPPPPPPPPLLIRRTTSSSSSSSLISWRSFKKLLFQRSYSF